MVLKLFRKLGIDREAILISLFFITFFYSYCKLWRWRWTTEYVTLKPKGEITSGWYLDQLGKRMDLGELERLKEKHLADSKEWPNYKYFEKKNRNYFS